MEEIAEKTAEKLRAIINEISDLNVPIDLTNLIMEFIRDKILLELINGQKGRSPLMSIFVKIPLKMADINWQDLFKTVCNQLYHQCRVGKYIWRCSCRTIPTEIHIQSGYEYKWIKGKRQLDLSQFYQCLVYHCQDCSTGNAYKIKHAEYEFGARFTLEHKINGSNIVLSIR